MRDTSFDAFFTVVGFAYQALLLANFVVRWLRPEIELRYGWITYGLFLLLGLGSTIYLVSRGAPSKVTIGPILLLVYAAFGMVVDQVLRLDWRDKPILGVLIPYVILYQVSNFAWFFPLWQMRWQWGLPFTVLYVIHTVLNTASHLPRAKG